MSLATPDKIQTLQRKLYLKAKREVHKQRVGSRGECRYPAHICETLGLVGPSQVLAAACKP